ncbi:MAG: serine/threonine-protein kinase [Candidatus Korobacteraceae bacterium]
MALTSDTKLGPYEIVALIGAGGMGEVYRARDLRLGRDVAVKVLPASFASDPDRLRRFEQEARAIAALNDPNIVGVYDIGQEGGTPYLVSELLEGESLRAVLARGPLSHRKAIDYSIQIAHGLAAAHGKGIAHRDLKPDNIFVTREGRVKILDFGLAKTIDKGGHDATMTSGNPATGVGTVVGTAGYMSPEQVRGATVDCRTDIFSFGTVLYEMLTGVKAFKRDTTAETMTAILHDDPPENPPDGRPLPPALDRIVHHCLEKAPEQRFQSARDLAFDLESITSMTSSGGLSAAKVKERKTRTSLIGAAAALVLLAGLAGWLLASARHAPTGAQFHQVTYRRGTPGTARFTPDGQNVIYTAAWEAAEPELYSVPADGVGGHPMGIKDARLLAVSSKGELAVALSPQARTTLLAPGNLARTTGNSAPKPEIENIQAADFTPDGSALAIVRFVPTDFMCQLEYPIGKVLLRERLIDDLRFSPNGKYLAFIAHTNPSDDRGTVTILRSTGEKVAASPLYESSQGLAWSVNGDEVWSSSPLESGEIHALSLSGKTRDPLAMPGRIHLRDISPKGQLLVGQGIARRGIVVSSNKGESLRDLSWLDFSYLRDISDDGKMILFEEEGSSTSNYTVYVRDADGSPAVPIGEGYAGALSRDKKWALAIKLTEPNHEIWLLPIGPGEPRRINPSTLIPAAILPQFLSDGKRIIYSANEAGHLPRVWLQDLNGGDPRPVSPEGMLSRNVSPDDKWVQVNVREGSTGKVKQALLSIDDGKTVEIKGWKPGELALGWTSDGQLYVSSPDTTGAGVKVEKLNPHTGARTAWRTLATAPIGGVIPDPPIITPDGNTYGFDYRVRLSDLYTVSGVR